MPLTPQEVIIAGKLSADRRMEELLFKFRANELTKVEALELSRKLKDMPKAATDKEQIILLIGLAILASKYQ